MVSRSYLGFSGIRKPTRDFDIERHLHDHFVDQSLFEHDPTRALSLAYQKMEQVMVHGVKVGPFQNVIEYVVCFSRTQILDDIISKGMVSLALEDRKNLVLLAIYSNAPGCLHLLLKDQPDSVKSEILLQVANAQDEEELNPKKKRPFRSRMKHFHNSQNVRHFWLRNEKEETNLSKQLRWALLKRGKPSNILRFLLNEHSHGSTLPVIQCHIIHHAIQYGFEEVLPVLFSLGVVESWFRTNIVGDTIISLLTSKQMIEKACVRQLLHSMTNIKDSNGAYPFGSPDAIWRKPSDPSKTLLHLSVYLNDLPLLKKLGQVPVYASMLTDENTRSHLTSMCDTYPLFYEITGGNIASYSSDRLLISDIHSVEYHWFFEMLTQCTKDGLDAIHTSSVFYDDILGIIMKYCTPSQLITLCLVCKQWMKMVLQWWYNKKSNNTVICTIKSKNDLKNLTQFLSRVKYLPKHTIHLSVIVDECSDMCGEFYVLQLWQTFSLLLERFNCSKLYLQMPHWWISKRLLPSLSAFTKLEHVELNSYRLAPPAVPKSSCTLFAWTPPQAGISSETLVMDLIQQPHLETVIATNVNDTDLQKAKQLALWHEKAIGSNLKHLFLDNSQLPYFLLFELDNGRIGRSLQSLRRSPTDKFSHLVCLCENLQRLDWNGEFLSSHVSHIQNLKYLQVLSVRKVNSSSIIKMIIEAMSSLKYLKIHEAYPKIDQAYLMSCLDSDNHNLEYFQISEERYQPLSHRNIPFDRLLPLQIGSKRKRWVHVVIEDVNNYDPVAPSKLFPTYQDYVNIVSRPAQQYVTLFRQRREHMV